MDIAAIPNSGDRSADCGTSCARCCGTCRSFTCQHSVLTRNPKHQKHPLSRFRPSALLSRKTPNKTPRFTTTLSATNPLHAQGSTMAPRRPEATCSKARLIEGQSLSLSSTLSLLTALQRSCSRHHPTKLSASLDNAPPPSSVAHTSPARG